MSADAESQQQTRRAAGGVRRRPGVTAPPHGRVHSVPVAPDIEAEAPSIAQAAASSTPIWETVPATRGITSPAGRRDRDCIMRRSLAVSDVIAAVVAVLFVVNPAVWGPGMSLRITDVLLVPFVILAAKAIGLYDRDQHVLRKTTLDELPSLIYLSVLYALTVWLAEDVLFNGWLTRPQVFTLVLTTFTLAALGRVLVRRVVTKLTPAERCLIVGAPARRGTHRRQAGDLTGRQRHRRRPGPTAIRREAERP